MSGKDEAEFTSGRKTSIRYYEVVLSVQNPRTLCPTDTASQDSPDRPRTRPSEPLLHLSGRRLYTTSSLPFPITLRQRAFLLELFIVPYQVFQGVVEFVQVVCHTRVGVW